VSHICDTVQTDHQHAPQCSLSPPLLSPQKREKRKKKEKDANIITLGTEIHTPADKGLNPGNKESIFSSNHVVHKQVIFCY
jgi:hypothetical protein